MTKTELGEIKIPIGEEESEIINVPEYIEAAYLAFSNQNLSDLDKFIAILKALGINTINLEKRKRNIEIRKEYYNIIDSLQGNGGQRPKKKLIQQELSKKYKIKIRQLKRILKK